MFGKKKNTIVRNIYDTEYDALLDERWKASQKLSDAVATCLIKETKTHLFPENVESYEQAYLEYDQAKHDVFTAKLHYIVIRQKLIDYYLTNHEHFRYCSEYTDPTNYIDADTIIERAIVRRAN